MTPGATGFRDRADAGAQVAERLMPLRDSEPIVLALPRGGVPVAHEVASALGAPLDVLAVRKLGAPQNPELGIGAIAEDGTGVIDQGTVRALGVSDEQLRAIIDRETAELRRRVALYRGERLPFDLTGRVVIVVDDGIATGVTDTAALRAVRSRNPERLVLAVPVCAPAVASHLASEADEVVTLLNPPSLDGVGRWYRDFSQVTDEEVLRLAAFIGRQWRPRHAGGLGRNRWNAPAGLAVRPGRPDRRSSSSRTAAAAAAIARATWP